LESINPEDERFEVINLEMNPGEVVFFSGHLFHGSRNNRTSDPRIAYALRFTTPEVSFDRLAVETQFSYLKTIVVRGVDLHHLNDFMSMPPPSDRS
jgi:ectoine hydroxylase-related dioxygenase (phytanoyl-CoA dioxygenase family)